MDFINQERISTAKPHVQRALGLVALCSRGRQLCSPAAGSLEPWLINPDSNQLPGAAQADAVSALSGFSLVFLTASFCCPWRGQFLLKTQRDAADFSSFDGKGLQGDTADRDQLSNSQPSRVISKGSALPAPMGMQSHTAWSPRREAHPIRPIMRPVRHQYKMDFTVAHSKPALGCCINHWLSSSSGHPRI